MMYRANMNHNIKLGYPGKEIGFKYSPVYFCFQETCLSHVVLSKKKRIHR
jgi:hypothetical protein